MELDAQSSEREPSALNEDLPEAKTKEALRVLILQRFTKWLDDVLAEEKPLEGIAAELLAELEDESGVGSTGNTYDLYSTWSGMTALTQEIKLQGRAFKQLSDKMAPLAGLGESIERLLAANKDALSHARRIAEEGREVRIERENRLKRDAQDRVRREHIRVIIDIRDKLIIGLRSANDSQRKLYEYSILKRINKMFINRTASVNYMLEIVNSLKEGNRLGLNIIASIHHLLEIVNSLKKGYRLGLDRLDEVLQQLGVHEIACEGKPFDPRIMNALDVEETDDAPDGMVLEVYRTGYMIDTEVLQPAQVKVARVPVQNV